MKKNILSIKIGYFLIFILFLSISSVSKAKADEIVLVEDNFEDYQPGSFPSSGGWQMWFYGDGSKQQTITNTYSYSPTNSLQLLGAVHDIWAGYAAIPINSNAPIIGFEVAVRVEQTTGQPQDNARVAFSTRVSSSISREYAFVLFRDNGVISSGGQNLQQYSPDTWYTVTQVINRDQETYNVWIDGELKAQNLAVSSTQGDASSYPSYGIEAFSLSQCYNHVAVYFDDVKVFSEYEADPQLTLEPPSGISQITLVGSGFAPNSEITVTWEELEIHTIPDPLITNEDGSFTAIITVQNQVTQGDYTVGVSNELGNIASSTFTVTSEPPLTNTPTPSPELADTEIIIGAIIVIAILGAGIGLFIYLIKKILSFLG